METETKSWCEESRGLKWATRVHQSGLQSQRVTMSNTKRSLMDSESETGCSNCAHSRIPETPCLVARMSPALSTSSGIGLGQVSEPGDLGMGVSDFGSSWDHHRHPTLWLRNNVRDGGRYPLKCCLARGMQSTWHQEARKIRYCWRLRLG